MKRILSYKVMMNAYRPPRINIRQKVGSLALFFAIPASLCIGLIALITTLSLLHVGPVNQRVWTLFGYGFIGAAMVCWGARESRLKTFIHELKHAVVVLLTGNSLTDFQVERGTGHVSYLLRVDKVRFHPFIVLAPYYFPLLSLPTLILCIVFEQRAHFALVCALAATLAIDVATAYQEHHPHQSDLRRIFGGTFVANVFILSVNIMWVSICLVWVTAKRDGYVTAVNDLVSLVQMAF